MRLTEVVADMLPALLISTGAVLLIGPSALRWAGVVWPRPRRTRWLLACIGAGVAVAMGVATVMASHTTITSTDQVYNTNPWNGYKVYLSSPRHDDSGSRGECGWEENINGRHWNYYAAFINNGGSGGLVNRTYRITVSANARDNGAVTNKNSSNNWGAHVHIVTHTNAISGCPSSAQYLLVMYRTGVANSTALRTQLINKLDPVLPGGQNSWNCDGLIECNSVNASRRAYVELFFHDNQASVDWFQAGGGNGTGVNNTWRYGFAVDELLGYPR